MNSFIDSAVTFFDIFDLPLATTQGFFFLHGRDVVVERRQSAVRHSDRKIMIARRACRILRWVPFVDAIFACNTVAMGNPDDASDIDVLVVARDGRLWLTRLIVTAVLSMTRLRRHGKKIRDRVCLSFYLTPRAFDLSAIAIPQDIYLAYWLRTLLPLFDPENFFDRLQNANPWADALAPRALAFHAAPRIRTDATHASRIWRRLWERAWANSYGDMLEGQAKALQRARMDRRNTNSAERRGGTGVVVSDAMMKFHENDRREEYRDEWRKRCNEYL